MSDILEEGLFKLMSTNAGLIALVGTRIYPKRLPSSAVMPAVTYSGLGGPRDAVQAGDSGLPHLRFQINCYADTGDYLLAKKVANAVVKLFAGYNGPAGTSGTIKCDVEHSPDGFDDVARRDFIPVDVLLWHQEGN